MHTQSSAWPIFATGLQTKTGRPIRDVVTQCVEDALTKVPVSVHPQIWEGLYTGKTSHGVDSARMLLHYQDYPEHIAQEDHRVILGAMFVALLCEEMHRHQGMGAKDLATLFTQWEIAACVSGKSNDVRNAAMLADFVPSLMSAVAHWPAQNQAMLHKQLYSTMSLYVPWTNCSDFKSSLINPTLLCLAHLSAQTPNRLWEDDYSKAVNSMELDEEHNWSNVVLASPLAPSTKLELIQKLHPTTWLGEFKPVAVSALLDHDQVPRLQQLPWSIVASENQALCAQYAPDVFALVNQHAPNFTWEDPQRLDFSLLQHIEATLKNTSSQHEVPSTLFETSM